MVDNISVEGPDEDCWQQRAYIPQLVIENLKTLTVSMYIGKILHTSVAEFLLKGDIASILIVLKNVSQTIPSFHSSGV